MLHTQNLGFLLLVALLCLVSARDDTLKEFAKGRDVTEAVVRKISKSGIFKQDNNFLLRLAYVESKFGDDNYTFREDYYGGIWQVEESVFRITQTSPFTLSSHYNAIQSQFQITWLEVKWKQLVIPLYSGLAASLYFACIDSIESIPQTVPTQFEYWKKYYRPFGDVGKFESDSNWLGNQTKCRGKMDLCIVLDGSGSINQVDSTNYQKAKDFVASMIESFTLDYTRIGMIVFSDFPATIFEIDNELTIPQLADQARKAVYPNSGTRTDLAINRAIQIFTRSSHGNHSFGSSGVPRIMIVFTDGQSNQGSNMIGAVAGIRNNNITSVAIGIGNSINPSELLQIALNEPRNVFTLQDFTSLQDFLQTVTSIACEALQTPSFNTKYDDVLQKQEKRFYHLKIPSEGITVDMSDVVGKTNGYWSRTDEVPSEAVHDGKIMNGLTYIPPSPHRTRSKRAVGEEDGKEDMSDVYITIEGIEQINNYTLSFVEGKVSGADNGARINSLAKYAPIVFVLFHATFN